MSAPYYADEFVTLWHGDCEDVLPTLDPASVDVLLVDPPYFQVKDEDWDRQWKRRDQFLGWLGGVIDLALPSLVPSASAWIFASPALTSRVEHQVIEPRLRVLNSIRWVKEAGWHQKADVEAQRRYLTAWEGVIFAERTEDACGDEAMALHRRVFAPLGRYIQTERERAGFSRRQVAARLVGYKNEDSANANIFNWELGKNLISERDYNSMREVLNGPGGDYLRREYEDLRREYEDLRRPFRLNRSGPVTDVWSFPPVMGYPGKHPCEKPLAMLDHMLAVSARPGGTVLDFCAGSGSTLRAAKDRGLRAIGVEMDERWCEHAANRLAQDVLDFGGAAC